MSQHLEKMELGDFIDVRGPNGLLVYNGKGTIIQIKVIPMLPSSNMGFSVHKESQEKLVQLTS